MAESHFHHKLGDLRTRLMRMGGAVEDQLRRALQGLFEADHAKARHAIAADQDIDRMELEVDEACIQLLALHQPAAADLRSIVAAMKVVTELERIGDQAVNIARSTLEPEGGRGLSERVLGRMAMSARAQLADSLDALARLDGELAERVIAADAALDDLERRIVQRVLHHAVRDPDQLRAVFRLAYVARCLERVGDHATNIAEMALYIADATVARHRRVGAPGEAPSLEDRARRQMDREGAAAAEDALDLDMRAHHAGEAPADRQP